MMNREKTTCIKNVIRKVVRVKGITLYWENKMQEAKREKESIAHKNEKDKNWSNW